MTEIQKTICTAFILSAESIRYKAYQDTGGVWTIGAGHTKDVRVGMTCDFSQVMTWLSQDLDPIFQVLSTSEDSNTCHKMAYVSFGYNVGINALRRVLAGTDGISNPTHVEDRHGNILTNLQARRNLELSLLKD